VPMRQVPGQILLERVPKIGDIWAYLVPLVVCVPLAALPS